MDSKGKAPVKQSRQSRPQAPLQDARRARSDIVAVKQYSPAVSPMSLQMRSSVLRDFARQIVLPQDVSSAITLPAPGASFVASRMFRHDIAINQTNIVNGSCHIYIPTSLACPIYITDASISTNYPAAIGDPFHIQFHVTDDKVTGYTPSNVVIGGVPVTLNDGRSVFAVPCDCSTVATYRFHNNSGEAKKVSVWTSGTGLSGSWTVVPTLNDTLLWAHENVQAQIPQIANFIYIELRSPFGNQEVVTGRINMSTIDAANCKMQFMTNHVRALWNKGSYFLENQAVKTVRLSSSAVLLTNTSAALEKQGDVYCGLVPEIEGFPSFNDYIALPQHKRYSGSAEHGCYMWSMPSQDEAFDLLPVQTARELYQQEDAFCITLSGVNPDSTFLLRTYFFVDLFSEKQIFEKIVPPIVTPEWRALVRLLAISPHCSCNPEHVKLFKDIMRRGFDLAKGAHQIYLANPELFQTLASTLLGLL